MRRLMSYHTARFGQSRIARIDVPGEGDRHVGRVRNPIHLVPAWFLATASAVAMGGMTLAQDRNTAGSDPRRYCEPSPYGNSTIPPGIRSRRVANVNGLTVHMLEAGYETPRPAGRAASAWLPGACLQLAQGDAAAGIRGLSRDRARPARLRPHHGLGRFV